MKARKNMFGILVGTYLALLGVIFSVNWGFALDYPTKPIEVIVPYAPGGGADLAARIFVSKLPEFIGQPVVVVNKPGGGSVLGALYVAKAKPDGYTLLAPSQSSVILSPITKGDIGYKPDDFEPICNFDDTPDVLTVKSDAPWKTLNDFIAEAKRSPGKLTFSSSGTFTTTHIPVELLASKAGIKLTHIPSSGSGPAAIALLGGHVQMCSSTLPSQLPHIRAGSIRPLAVTTLRRIKELPDTPTLIELGYNIKMIVWHGLFAPKGTSKQIIDKVYSSVKTMYDRNKQEIDSKLEKMGSAPNVIGPKEFADLLKEEYDASLAVYKLLGKTDK